MTSESVIMTSKTNTSAGRVQEFPFGELREIIGHILTCAAKGDARGVHEHLQPFLIERVPKGPSEPYINGLWIQTIPSGTLASGHAELAEIIDGLRVHVMPTENIISVGTTTPSTRTPTDLRITVEGGRVPVTFRPSDETGNLSLRFMSGNWFATQKSAENSRDCASWMGRLRIGFRVPLTKSEAAAYVEAQVTDRKRKILEAQVTDRKREILEAAPVDEADEKNGANGADGAREVNGTNEVNGANEVNETGDAAVVHDRKNVEAHEILVTALKEKRNVTVVAAYAVPLYHKEASPAMLGTELSKLASWPCPDKTKAEARYCSLVQAALDKPLEYFFTNVVVVKGE